MARSKSITEIQILNLLNLRPMYGAEMIEEIKRLSGNTVVMSLPTLYSALHKLATKKLVNSYWQEAEIGGRRHVYNITQAGRDYHAKNKIEINYDLLKQSQPTDTPKTFATLEEAFSLPLQNQTTIPELPEDKRVLKVEQPEAVTPKSQITPYLLPTDKITTTDAVKHKQMSISLTGTVGSPDLRPLLKLNQVTVGNNFVTINRLRMVACVINILIFGLLNFIFSISQIAQSEYFNLIYLLLGIYFAVELAIYIVFPRVKTIFMRGKTFRRCTLVTLGLIAVLIIICIVDHSLKQIWLGIFAFMPVVHCILMMSFQKGRIFQC